MNGGGGGGGGGDAPGAADAHGSKRLAATAFESHHNYMDAKVQKLRDQDDAAAAHVRCATRRRAVRPKHADAATASFTQRGRAFQGRVHPHQRPH
jgi:hypothetical protein